MKVGIIHDILLLGVGVVCLQLGRQSLKMSPCKYSFIVLTPSPSLIALPLSPVLFLFPFGHPFTFMSYLLLDSTSEENILRSRILVLTRRMCDFGQVQLEMLDFFT